MSQRVGLWLIGAQGGVASVVATGLAALQAGATDDIGLVSCLPEFDHLRLLDWNSMVVGGHEIRSTSLPEAARQFQQSSRAFDASLVDQSMSALREMDSRIRPGILANAGPAITALANESIKNDCRTAREKVEQVEADLAEFAKSQELERVVIVNLASTEPPVDAARLPVSWKALDAMLDDPDCPLPSSSLYAIAALSLGHGWVNFTPSLGASCEAITELALLKKVPLAGRDGKTGETLIKSVLAPAFAIRNLRVMSWVGHNIFGNLDGEILDDPANKQSKVASKDRLLAEILGYRPQSHISIEYIASLGDWKTAWDHIHFRGFLGTPMVMQFTWQGCDSILAAPLVLDLFRFVERAGRTGESGVLGWLACFFKAPEGVSENNLTLQFEMLRRWAATRAGG